MKIQKPHFTITRINDNRTVWHLIALIVAASMLLLLATALNTAGAATNPPQGNVVPNFSGLRVAGPAELTGTISDPSGNPVRIDDDLAVGNPSGEWASKNLYVKNIASPDFIVKMGSSMDISGVIKNSTTENSGAVTIGDKLEINGNTHTTKEIVSDDQIVAGGLLRSEDKIYSGGNITAAGIIYPQKGIDISDTIRNSTTTNGGAVKIDDDVNIGDMFEFNKGSAMAKMKSSLFIRKPADGIVTFSVDAKTGNTSGGNITAAGHVKASSMVIENSATIKGDIVMENSGGSQIGNNKGGYIQIKGGTGTDYLRVETGGVVTNKLKSSGDIAANGHVKASSIGKWTTDTDSLNLQGYSPAIYGTTKAKCPSGILVSCDAYYPVSSGADIIDVLGATPNFSDNSCTGIVRIPDGTNTNSAGTFYVIARCFNPNN